MALHPRVRFLNDVATPHRPHVGYWMQASARTRSNHALEYAVELANRRQTGLLVFYVISPTFPDATLRHYWFLLQGLKDVQRALHVRGIPFTVFAGSPPGVATQVCHQVGALVTDMGYTRLLRNWRSSVADGSTCPVIQVESNVVVPVETASGKEEYAARTIRPKILRHKESMLEAPTPVPLRQHPDVHEPIAASLRAAGVTELDLSRIDSPDALLAHIEVAQIAREPSPFHGGEVAAQKQLSDFVTNRLVDYDSLRNIPDLDWQSGLSPYLHFGHISPIDIVLAARNQMAERGIGISSPDVQAFEEELVVRRELAINFTYHNPGYDTYAALPTFARDTLRSHIADPRPYVYDKNALEAADTHDPYWNAAQHQMVSSGKMHGYMRMYWGKKLIEWMADPEEAFHLALKLNDRYELDGRDPNGYAGVAWCFGKHDRGWPERPIFGKIRYMNDAGLRRKFKSIDVYLRRWGQEPPAGNKKPGPKGPA